MQFFRLDIKQNESIGHTFGIPYFTEANKNIEVKKIQL